ncbi:MAG: DUF3284 domain-containing protein [Clostridium sp.]|nr:DUF3284 domain-containing protein [Clostridium sp.]
MAFSNSAVINYPVEKVFNVFIRTAKKDFPKFNESNPIGCKIVKKVGTYSAQSAKLEVEITNFKKNELYEIKSSSPSSIYTSKYTFEVVDENSTRITLVEDDVSRGFVPWFNVLIQNLVFKGRVKKRFTIFIEGLIREIDIFDEKLAKNSKSRAEEAQKIEEKKKAVQAKKEQALRAKKEAEEARLNAEKALKEAELLEKEAQEAEKQVEEY